MRKNYSDAVNRVVIKINTENKRGRKRPKKRWIDGIEYNMKIAGAN